MPRGFVDRSKSDGWCAPVSPLLSYALFSPLQLSSDPSSFWQTPRQAFPQRPSSVLTHLPFCAGTKEEVFHFRTKVQVLQEIFRRCEFLWSFFHLGLLPSSKTIPSPSLHILLP